VVPLVSCETRLSASEAKATYRPFAEIATLRSVLSPLAASPIPREPVDASTVTEPPGSAEAVDAVARTASGTMVSAASPANSRRPPVQRRRSMLQNWSRPASDFPAMMHSPSDSAGPDRACSPVRAGTGSEGDGFFRRFLPPDFCVPESTPRYSYDHASGIW
jgi:hypothetical protein